MTSLDWKSVPFLLRQRVPFLEVDAKKVCPFQGPKSVTRVPISDRGNHHTKCMSQLQFVAASVPPSPPFSFLQSPLFSLAHPSRQRLAAQTFSLFFWLATHCVYVYGTRECYRYCCSSTLSVGRHSLCRSASSSWVLHVFVKTHCLLIALSSPSAVQ